MLLSNARYVVTQDDDRRVLEDVDIRTEDGRIEKVGKNLEADGETVDCSGKAVLPGLVNAHTHAAMTLLRGISDSKPLQRWLEDDIFPAEEEMGEEDVAAGTRLASLEMLTSGTTTFNDMYVPGDVVAEVVDDVGIRAVIGHGMMDIEGDTRETLEKSEEFVSRWSGHDLIKPSVAPHAVYTCSRELLEGSGEQAAEFDAPLHIHLSETERENRDCREEHGMSPAEYLDGLGLLNGRTVAAHGVHLSDSDIRLMAERGAGVVHNPAANLKLGSGVAPVHELREAGVTVGLGTDGVASNNSLNLFEEMKLASLMQKERDPRTLPAQDVLDMATRDDAELLGLDHEIGSIEEGKRADLVTVDLSRPEMRPIHGIDGLISNLVFSFDGTVSDVMVDGELLVRDETPVSTGLAEAVRDVQERSERILNAAES